MFSQTPSEYIREDDQTLKGRFLEAQSSPEMLRRIIDASTNHCTTVNEVPDKVIPRKHALRAANSNTVHEKTQGNRIKPKNLGLIPPCIEQCLKMEKRIDL